MPNGRGFLPTMQVATGHLEFRMLLEVCKTCATKCCIRCKLHVLICLQSFLSGEKSKQFHQILWSCIPVFIMAINVIRNNWNQFLFTSKPHMAKDFWLTELVGTSFCSLNLQSLSQFVLKSYLNLSVLSTKVS